MVVGHECDMGVFDDATFAIFINDDDVSDSIMDSIGNEKVELTVDIASDLLFSCPHIDNENNFYDIECPVLF